MASKNDISKIMQKHGLGQDDVWNCHGTWVILHKACEKIAADNNIIFDAPQFIEANAKDKIVAVVVTGRMGDKVEWSVGEAAPYNNKNTYPYAMAEKRAKDRVILKLVGLHGEVYSEEEADDFKKPPIKNTPSLTAEDRADALTQWGKQSYTLLKKIDEPGLDEWLADSKNLKELEKLSYVNEDAYNHINKIIADRKDEFNAKK